MDLYGRDRQVEALARSDSAVTVLTGDSGTGKSAVLAAAQVKCALALAPDPRTIPYTGILQQALLQALADALALHVQRRGMAGIAGDHLVDAARRMARESGHALASVVGRELLALVRGRLGPEFGSAIGEYIQQLRESVDENLTARLSAALDPGVTGLVVDFAQEISDVSESPVVLALDAGERLSDESVRLLADVADNLPESVRVRIAVADYTSDQRRSVRFLESVPDVSVQRLEGLSEEAIGQWLVESSLDPSRARSVRRATAGYALHVGDLVQHLQSGGEVDDAPLSQQFANRTREAWEALDRKVEASARRLCALRDPLPAELTAAFLGLDMASWRAMEDVLWRSRVFSVEVNGRRWFHEQRRRFAYESILDSADRDLAASEAVAVLYDHIVQSGETDRAPELADIAADASSLHSQDEQLAGALSMDRDEVAICSSLLELIEDPDLPAALADDLLSYTRAMHDADGDLVSALRRVGTRGFVTIAEDGDRAAVVPYWSTRTIVVVAGRASNELGRTPVPRAASALWEVELQPRIGRFKTAQYGLGRPSASGLGEIALELRQRERGQLIVVGRPPAGQNLLVRADYGDRPVYAAVTFSTGEDRDAASGRIENLAGELFGQPFTVLEVLAHPTGPVPARRLVGAVERVTGKRFPTTASVPKLHLKTPMPIDERLRRKAAAIAFARERLSLAEQRSAEVEQPVGYAYHSDDNVLVEVEIIGGRTGAHPVLDLRGYDLSDPFDGFRLAEAVDLQPGERSGSYSIRYGGLTDPTDPVVDEFAVMQGRASKYNAGQERLLIPLDEESLAPLLERAATRTYEDALALTNAVAVGDEQHPVCPLTSYLTIFLDPPRPGLIPGVNSAAYLLQAESPDQQERVFVRIDNEKASRTLQEMGIAGYAADVADRFDLDHQPQAIRLNRGALRGIAARMLGYLEDDIIIKRPD